MVVIISKHVLVVGGYAPITKADHEDARAPPYEHMTQSIVTGQPMQER